MDGRKLLDDARSRRDEMIEALRALVEHESPSRAGPALDALASHVAARFEALGGLVERIGGTLGGAHLRIGFQGESDDAPPALVLAHYDTVWPLGTLARLPFRIADGRAFGPGVYDMKASLVVVEFALRALAALGLRPARPVVVLITSDEEIGSPTSRAPIEAEARSAGFALVMEPPLAGGRLKTGRKGVGRFTLTITGRAAHAGAEPEKGVSAVVELAHQILQIQALADPASGTTLNVGVVEGGSAPNVIPARATAAIDVRVSTLDEARRIEEAFAALVPHVPGAILDVTGGLNRPPMERTPRGIALFERVRSIARALDLDLNEGSTGGGSDANFTAALGLPTLDGLGVQGAGAHAEHEQIELDSLVERAALLALLLLRL